MNLLVLLFAVFLTATPQPDGDSSRTGKGRDGGFEPKFNPSQTIPRTSTRIKIDGAIDPAEWQQSALLNGFSEIQPDEKKAARVETNVFVTYDDNHIYFAFQAFDDPRTIRVSLRNRDQMFEDDWVGIILDPFGDATNAYEIFANPMGVQGDLMMSSGQNENSGFNMVYRSEGRITENGYEVEMAIPFSSLRFPNSDVQSWHMTAIRNHPRDVRRIYSWAAVESKNTCLLCQLGTISGIEGARAGQRLKVIPSFVGYQSGSLRDDDAIESGFKNHRFRPEASLNARYDLTSSITAEATVNPDFSQIESDAAQIDVNSTFALFYPERRPFFQEGADMFQTQHPIFYSRSINNPITAIKTTGRTGKLSLAYLSAVDEDSPVLMPFQEYSELVNAGQSVSNVLRTAYALKGGSHIGTIITDRRFFEGGSGTTASVDWRFRSGKYSLDGQYAFTNTVEPNDTTMTTDLNDDRFADGRYTVGFNGESFAGHGASLQFRRDDRYWNFGITASGSSPTLRTSNGFITDNDNLTLESYQTVSIWPKKGFLNRIGPGIFARKMMDYNGQDRGYVGQAYLNLNGKGQTYLYSAYTIFEERFKNQFFRGMWNVQLQGNTSFLKQLSGGAYTTQGLGIWRGDDVPEYGRFIDAGAFITIKPIQRLVFSPEINYSRMKARSGSETFYNGFIFRAGTTYQFTRELSVRLVTQYNDFDSRYSIEPLVAYQLNPFSVFYLGSTHNMGDFGPNWGVRETHRQFFFKMQYLLQR